LKNIDYLTFGAHQLVQLKALHLDGDFDSVINLLQGQVTSDCSKLKDGEGQPSALCDEKGYVLCNFDILLHKKLVLIAIDNELESIFLYEMKKFAPFYKVAIKPFDITFTGWIRKPHEDMLPNEQLIINGDDAHVSLLASSDKRKIEENTEDTTSMSWSLNRKLLEDHIIQKKDSCKFRPHELMQHISRVSFSKGCFRGQEIIARMEYLGKQKKQTALVVHSSKEEVQKFEIIGQTLSGNGKYFSSCMGPKDSFNY
jgi:tRNA-modifying protein YgfZ